MLFYKALEKINSDYDITFNDDKSILIKVGDSDVVFEYVENADEEIKKLDFFSLINTLSNGPRYTYSESKVNLSEGELQNAPQYGLDEDIDGSQIQDDVHKVSIRFHTTNLVSDHYFSSKVDNLFLSNMEKDLISYLIFDGRIELSSEDDQRFLSQFDCEVDDDDVLVVENTFSSYQHMKSGKRDKVSIYVLKNAFSEIGKKMVTINNNSCQYSFSLLNALRKNGYDINEIIVDKQWINYWDVKNIGYFEQQRVRIVDPISVILEYSPFTMYKPDAVHDFYTLSEDKKWEVKNSYIIDENGKYISKAYDLLVKEGLSRELIKSLLSLRTNNGTDVSTAVFTSSLLTARNIGVKMANYRKSYIDNSKLYKKFITFYELCSLGHFSDLLEIIDEEVKLKDAKTVLTTPSVFSKYIIAKNSDKEVESKFAIRRMKKIMSILEDKEKIKSIIRTFITVANVVKDKNLVNVWVNEKYLNNLEDNFDNIVVENNGSLSINEDYLSSNLCSDMLYYNLLEGSLLDAKNVYEYGDYSNQIKFAFSLLSLFDNLLFRYER